VKIFAFFFVEHIDQSESTNYTNSKMVIPKITAALQTKIENKQESKQDILIELLCQ